MALTNGNITLRALEPDDVELLYRWENDSEVWKVSNTRTPLSKFALANYIKSADKDIWEIRELRVIIESNDGKALGTVELFDFEPYHSRAGIGVMIYDNSNRRKGIASEAMNVILDYARNELGIAQIYANIAAENEPSIQLFKRLGFELIGTKKKWLRTPIGWDDELMFQKFL